MKIRRYIITVFIGIICVIASLEAPALMKNVAMAAEILDSGYCGAHNLDNNGKNIKWTLDSEGTLTISGTGMVEDSDYNYYQWYQYKDKIKNVIFENGVTNIPRKAFYKYEYIETVNISDSVTEICDSAFDGCTLLTSIILPDSVTTIGEHAFLGTSIKSLTIPDSVTNIGNYAFGGCKYLASVTIPDTITSIAGGMFSACSSLDSIIIPDTVSIIGKRAFAGCSLKSITIPDSVTQIDDFAFNGCSSLESITIPNSVNVIGAYAFMNCSSLKSIMLPNSITEIRACTFSECTSLSSITISASVASIGLDAFSKCSSLESIIIPANVKGFSTALTECEMLKSVTFYNPNCNIINYDSTICNTITKSGSKYIHNYSGVIRGYKGSTAEAYAKKFNKKFEPIDGVVTVTTNPSTTTSITSTTSNITTTNVKLSVNVSNITLENGEKYTIKANQSNLTYKSTNTDVAIVSKSGIITAIGEGEAVIFVINADYDVVQINCRVTKVLPVNYGDANEDGIINLSDAVLIMQSLSNPGKYGENGNDPSHITVKGKRNADVSENGNGVTNKDALAIQKYMLKLITSLPE